MSPRAISLLLKYSLLLSPLALLPMVSCQNGGGGGGGGNQLANALLACGLLTQGTLSPATESTEPFDTCMFQCIASSTCAELEGIYCNGDFGPEEACLEQCLASNGFDCGDGEKVFPIWACDGSADCANGADELNCPGPFICGDGSEITPSWKCDGEPDCMDGSDEVDCPVLPTFTCTSGEQIPANWQCDYENDCPDGSDETGCAQLVCPNAETGPLETSGDTSNETGNESPDPSDTGPLETSTGL
jgi:hypothetical protein